MKNFKLMMVLFVMIAALCFTACESDKDDESTVPAPTCDPACAGDTECKCEADKCECVDKIEKEDLKPEDCKCEPACTEGKECKCEGDKKECVEKPKDQVKPEDCKCDPACTDGKVCKCEGDKKECVDAPAEPSADKK